VVQRATGNFPGLTQALLEALAQYQPSEGGVCYINPEISIVLPLEGWSRVGRTSTADTVLTAGQSDQEPFWTVPADERHWIHAIFMTRTGGDNTISQFYMNYPEGYFTGVTGVQLIAPDAGQSQMWWPIGINTGEFDAGAHQMPGPVMMEPGTVLEVNPNGVGVAISTFHTELLLTTTKLVRALAPGT